MIIGILGSLLVNNTSHQACVPGFLHHLSTGLGHTGQGFAGSPRSRSLTCSSPFISLYSNRIVPHDTAQAAARY
ncbi:hypothetical protein ES702_00300 [subsurface metagenome]